MENKFKLSSFNLKYSGAVALVYLLLLQCNAGQSWIG